jgi:hypothetical protein
MHRSFQLAKEAQDKLAALPSAVADVENAVTAANALLLQTSVSPPAELPQVADAMILALADTRDRASAMERALADASSKVVA